MCLEKKNTLLKYCERAMKWPDREGGKRQNHQQLMELKRNNLKIEFQLRNNGECIFFF